MNSVMISIGNFLFKHRNLIFPAYILALFLAFQPPAAFDGPGRVRVSLAVLAALSGLVLRGMVIGLAYIKRGGLDRKVYAADLVTGGMFSVCRNPLYVGNMLIYSGVFLMFGKPAAVALGIISFWFIYECIIAAEENYLRGKFGAAYGAYCRDVPRWFPNPARIAAAFSGFRFDWRKVLFKDYPTICTTAAFLAVIRLWEILAHHGLGGQEREVSLLSALILWLPLTALAIRGLKKSARFAGDGRISGRS